MAAVGQLGLVAAKLGGIAGPMDLADFLAAMVPPLAADPNRAPLDMPSRDRFKPLGTADHVRLLRTVFDRFDFNRNGARCSAAADCLPLSRGARAPGTMETRELQAAMKAMGVELTPDEARRMLVAADRDGSGTLDFGEFSALVLPRLQTSGGVDQLTAAQMRTVRQVFDRFDKDRSGEANESELHGCAAGLSACLCVSRTHAQARLTRANCAPPCWP